MMLVSGLYRRVTFSLITSVTFCMIFQSPSLCYRQQQLVWCSMKSRGFDGKLPWFKSLLCPLLEVQAFAKYFIFLGTNFFFCKMGLTQLLCERSVRQIALLLYLDSTQNTVWQVLHQYNYCCNSDKFSTHHSSHIHNKHSVNVYWIQSCQFSHYSSQQINVVFVLNSTAPQTPYRHLKQICRIIVIFTIIKIKHYEIDNLFFFSVRERNCFQSFTKMTLQAEGSCKSSPTSKCDLLP